MSSDVRQYVPISADHSIAWKNVLEDIKRTIEPSLFATWFDGGRAKLVRVEEGVATIGSPSAIYQRNLEKKFGVMISEKLNSFGVEHNKINFVIDTSDIQKKRVQRAREVLSWDEVRKPVAFETTQSNFIRGGKVEDTGLNPQYRFDNFIVGTNNDAAMGAAQRVVENPGNMYNPYYLYGGPGLGKTHLIQAIGNEILACNPKMKVKYLTTEQFYSSYIQAMQKRISGFGAEYRKLDVLIIDDIQMITGKDKSQEEFFNIFNELYMRKKQIIVSSDRMPAQIATMDARLSTRLLSGVPIDIQMPDFETRCAILAAKAEFAEMEIGQNAIEYIANNIRTNIRELEGKLNQLRVLSEVRGLSIDEIIGDGYLVDAGFGGAKNLTPKRIIDQVAKYYKLTPDDLRSVSRAHKIAKPRHIAAYLIREEMSLSLPKIAAELGGRHHTSIMSSLKYIEDGLKTNFQLREDINMLKNKIFAEN